MTAPDLILAQERGVLFTRGIPSADEVATHEREHASIDDRGAAHGGIWLAIDDACAFGPMPQLMHLKVGHGRYLVSNQSTHDGQYRTTYEDVTGVVMLRNGYTFWQVLDRCVWAARTLYTPVTPRGVPVRWRQEGPCAPSST